MQIAKTEKELETTFIHIKFPMKAYPNVFNPVPEVGLLNTTSLKVYCDNVCSDGSNGLDGSKLLLLWSLLTALVWARL